MKSWINCKFLMRTRQELTMHTTFFNSSFNAWSKACFLLILLFFAHPIVLHILLFCTFYIAHFTLISLFFNHIYAIVLCYFYIILIFYSSVLSTERTWFDYISLLVIPCIIYYVTNKETLKPWTLNLDPVLYTTRTEFSNLREWQLHSTTKRMWVNLQKCTQCEWNRTEFFFVNDAFKCGSEL